MATFTHEVNRERSSSKVGKQQESTRKSDSTTVSSRRRSIGFRKSSGGLRRGSVEPNSRTRSMISDVSMRDSPVFNLRPLPPLLKNGHQSQRSTENTSSYLELVASRPRLPPIKRTHQHDQTYSDGKQNTGSYFHRERVMLQTRLRSSTMLFDEGVDDLFQGEQFSPLRVSTPKNSKTMLRPTNSRTLPKPNRVTFRQSSDEEEGIVSSSYTRTRSSSTSRYDSSSDTNHGGDTDKKERRRLRRTNTRQWVRSSDFTLKTSNDKAQSSSETDSFQTVSLIPFDDGRYPENRKKPTSTEQLRRIISNIQPPPLPFKILVHERVTKFNIDFQFRVQRIRDWWSELRFPRLPKITIDIDFARSREAVRRLCARLRNSLRFPPPLILDPPPRFIIIPPSEWTLHQVSMPTDEQKRHKIQPLQQYNRKVECYLQGDVAMVADDDHVNLPSDNRRPNTNSGFHATFVDEKEDGALNDFKRRRYSSSSRPDSTKSYCRPLPKLPTPLTKNAGVSEVKFHSARERLAFILKKLDDPCWFGTWIAKHDEMERDLKRLGQKRLDLIRALTFTVDNEPCQRSMILGQVYDDTDRAETRQRMRVHQQYAHHRFGMSQRQPSTTLQPVIHADATAQGSEDTVYWSKQAQPVYTDERPGCIACRVMKAARRYGCEERLSQLSSQPTIENFYSTTLLGDAMQN